MEPLEVFGVRLGLDRTRRTLDRLGRPQERFASVLVAGTNGKGSTACLLAAMATAAGYRTGLYTSPHLESVEERVRIDGVAIDRGELAAELHRAIEAARRASAEPPTYFEALTVAALGHFARCGVELAVLEVGLGGRLDATNVVEPEVSVIGEVSLDHEAQLGDTSRSVAREKAGILRRGRPAVAWTRGVAAARELQRRATELGADLREASREVRVEILEPRDWTGGRLLIGTPVAAYEVESPLAGAHQRRNLGLAVRAAELLAGRGWQRLALADAVRGVERCRWPGRLERVELAEAAVLLDAAHNPSGARALVDFLRRRGRPYRLLFGVLGDKKVETMLPSLAAAAEQVVLTAPPHPRAAPPDRLAALVGGRAATCEPSVAVALDRGLAQAAATPEGGLLLICGSIFLVGEARRLLRERYGTPYPATDPLLIAR